MFKIRHLDLTKQSINSSDDYPTSGGKKNKKNKNAVLAHDCWWCPAACG
jgi:hypothetical protein